MITVMDPVIIPAADHIHLNETEKKIFELLKGCVKTNNLQVNLRVAGGWVRDKLLGLECQDVDIAIDTMMGQAFTNHLCAYMKSLNLEARSVGVIQSNPDRSKHLETATLALFGQPIDFVNLRAEQYASGSRIPHKIVFGTPLEDALRRDITINSMFYHIQDETIEDWTGHGLLDLEEGIIRTPLPTETTLLDDPLRLLRIIRFGSRYGYALVPEIVDVARQAHVHDAFLAKVSRERVGIEFDKTVSGRNGLVGLHLYERLNAFPLLTMQKEDVDYSRLLAIFEAVACSLLTDANRRLCLLAFPLLPFPFDAISSIARTSLKLGNKDTQEILRLYKNIDLIAAYGNESQRDPVKLGRLVKDVGEHWKIAVFLSCVRYIFENDELVDGPIDRFTGLASTVERLGLSEAWRMACLLSGKHIQNILGIKEGAEVGQALGRLFDWQCQNPAATVEDAIKFVGSTATKDPK